LATPLGWLEIRGDQEGVSGISFVSQAEELLPVPASLRCCVGQLKEYFAGERRTFQLPVLLLGTPFQLKVWQSLRQIPFGRTATYGEIARSIGSLQAARAVGQASHANPLVIVVPCHRLIGANGDLTGFGGGLWRKRWLLDFERQQSQP
jgi:methylated-DNA-[protein]-cysteine S-methyltransferase